MIIDSDFSPKRLWRNPHWQSAWPTLIMRRKPSLKTKRERLILDEGDYVDIEWCSDQYQWPIVILLHGITGNIDAPYIKYLVPELINHHFCPVMMYYRGYSGIHNRYDILTHAGKTDDFSYLVTLLQQRFPTQRLMAIGFSQGANMLLKYLGEQGDNTAIERAIAISTPFQLRSVANTIRYGASRMFQSYLLKKIKAYYINKFEYRHNEFDPEKIKHCRSFWQLDELVTAKLNGFDSAIDYYTQASCHRYLKNISINTLIIHAADDPIMSPDIIPVAQELGDLTQLEVSTYGGHVGFMEGTLCRPKFWLNRRIPHYLNQTFNKK